MPLLPANYTTPTTCERCNTRFECGVHSNIPCQCMGIRLSNEARQSIKDSGYVGCLCNKCLLEIEAAVDKSVATYAYLPEIG